MDLFGLCDAQRGVHRHLQEMWLSGDCFRRRYRKAETGTAAASVAGTSSNNCTEDCRVDLRPRRGHWCLFGKTVGANNYALVGGGEHDSLRRPANLDRLSKISRKRGK